MSKIKKVTTIKKKKGKSSNRIPCGERQLDNVGLVEDFVLIEGLLERIEYLEEERDKYKMLFEECLKQPITKRKNLSEERKLPRFVGFLASKLSNKTGKGTSSYTRLYNPNGTTNV